MPLYLGNFAFLIAYISLNLRIDSIYIIHIYHIQPHKDQLKLKWIKENTAEKNYDITKDS